MAQFGRPNADVSAGSWSPSTGGDLYAVLDEVSASDSDYVYSVGDPVDDTFEVSLSTVTDPTVSTGHTLKYRYKKTGDDLMDLTVELRQGASTVIASWVHNSISSTVVEASQTLSAGEADSITDYSDLRARFVADLVTAHALLADDVATAVSTVSIPAIGQAHALLADDVATAVPTASVPALGQEHALLADDVATAVPAVTSPALVEVTPLLADDVATAASTVSVPTIGQEHAFLADDVATAVSTVSSPAIGQEHVLLADDVATAAPTASSPVLAEAGDADLTMHLDFAQNDGSTINSAITSGPASLTFARASLGTSFDESGVMQIAASGDPRYDHDPGDGDAALGILIEGAATNVCLQSEDFGTTWTNSTSLTTNTTTAPDGATTADTLDDDDGSGAEVAFQAITVANDSTSWCFSLFVKKDADTSRFPGLRCRLLGGTGKDDVLQLNTSTGAITEVTGSVFADSGVIDAGDYWRPWAVVANNSTGNTTARFYVYPADGTSFGTSAASATGSAICWGTQLENTAYPTSYIPTTTGSVTRITESLDTTSVAWVNADYTGSWIVEAKSNPAQIGTNQALFKLVNTDLEHLTLMLDAANSALDCRATSSPSFVVVSTSTFVNAAFKAGVAVVTNDGELYADGASEATDTGVSLTGDPAPNKLWIGKVVGAGSEVFLGHIKDIKYYDVRKDDTFMNAATT